jgi:hypothetical protein
LTPEGGNCRACCFKHQTAFTELSNQKLKNSKTQKLKNSETQKRASITAKWHALLPISTQSYNSAVTRKRLSLKNPNPNPPYKS